MKEGENMAIHTRIEPDCPNCGRELTSCYRSLPPFTNERPWGSSFEAWYSCGCGFETEHATADHKDEAKAKALELASKYMPKQ